MGSRHAVTGPVSTMAPTRVSVMFYASNSRIGNNLNIFFNNAPLKDSLWMINNAKLKVKQNNMIPELNPSLANIN